MAYCKIEYYKGGQIKKITIQGLFIGFSGLLQSSSDDKTPEKIKIGRFKGR